MAVNTMGVHCATLVGQRQLGSSPSPSVPQLSGQNNDRDHDTPRPQARHSRDRTATTTTTTFLGFLSCTANEASNEHNNNAKKIRAR
jgi:hypothetical protein